MIKKMFKKATKEGLTMDVLGARIGIHPTYLSTLKANPDRAIREATVAKIQKYLGVTIPACSSTPFVIHSGIPVPPKDTCSPSVATFLKMKVGDCADVPEKFQPSFLSAVRSYIKKNELPYSVICRKVVETEGMHRVWKVEASK